MVTAIMAPNWNASGSVASPLSAASAWPTSTPIAPTADVEVRNSAWQIDSRKTFLWE